MWLWVIISLSAACAVAGVALFVSALRRRRFVPADAEDAWLINEFARCNVIVSGKIGSGKDVLFAHVIYLRAAPHYSNVSYDELTEVINLDSLSLFPNTFESCLSGDIVKVVPRFEERRDFYISDGGVYLASQEDKALVTAYPSMPMFFALIRHLYDSHVHVNVQNIGRLWKKLREQADSYIRVLSTTEYDNYLLVKAISYDNYESAERGYTPSDKARDVMAHGEIKEHSFKVYKWELHYDTRYFRNVFFAAPDIAGPHLWDKEAS
jgi:hypothetical protein